MIEFDRILFSQGTRTILRGISFKVQLSERVAILGGSGEGKTTMLKLLLRLFEPDSGRILVDGVDITHRPEQELAEVRRKFSIVFQDGALFDSLNVKENVAFNLREYTKPTEEALEQRVRELLRVVDLEDAIDLMPEELSGGMQRRVAIARALAAQEPRMFLYDEPTSDLDPVNAATIRKLVLDLAHNGRGFIMVTHEILDALQVANRFMFLKGGKVLFDGDKEQLLRSELPELTTFIGNWREGLR